MALFSLTDISFNKNTKERVGSASSQIVGGQYESKILRYPQDVGNYDRGHYMVFHINEQLQSSYEPSGGYTGEQTTFVQNKTQYGIPTTNQNLGTAAGVLNSAVNAAKGSTVGKLIDDVKNSTLGRIGGDMVKSASSIRGLRTTKRVAETIALYMPDTMNFVNSQVYSDLTLGTPGQLLAAGASISQSLRGTNRPGNELVKNLSPFAANILLRQSNLGKFVSSSALGVVENPMLELLYTSPSFRSFRFDFLFYPRSIKESEEVQRILASFRYHQAPEIMQQSNGFFLVPPSEFDVKFYYNGAENNNIQKISSCVLESVDIDYAPNGWSAYEVPGEIYPDVGRSGMPVAIRLILQFKETEIMTKAHYAGEAGKRTQASAINRQQMSDAYREAGQVNDRGEGIF